MSRRLRHGLQGAAFHLMNRAVRRSLLFEYPQEYDAFLVLVREGLEKSLIKIIAYCLMPNHWHFVVTCDRIEHISKWLQWLSSTHAIRWNLAHNTRGTGAVYQSRFKAVPIQTETSLARVCRYVERNALRKGLVKAAEQWKWGSLHACCENCYPIPLQQWPILRPPNWVEIVNREEDPAQIASIRKTIWRNQPIGDPDWQKAVAPFAGLSMRPIGRPKRSPTPFPKRKRLRGRRG